MSSTAANISDDAVLEFMFNPGNNLTKRGKEL